MTAPLQLPDSDRLADLKQRLAEAIDRHAEDLAVFGEDIFDHAEIGFREERTATKIADELRRLGMQPREGLAITGVKARLRGGRPGPTVCVMAELDGLLIPEHPRADKATGVVHACGHNAQLTHLVAVARALVETDALAELAGDVVFLAVPAEEYIDLEWRAELARAGRLEFLGGKGELLRLGEFDDVDVAMMIHATGRSEDQSFSIRPSANGLVAKQVQFIGKPSHAGSAPHLGINALNAATLAMQAIHMQRETFRDDDHIRVHPILTRGGATVNVVPSDVRLETFVRGATYQSIAEADAKVDRAIKSGAMAVGASVEIRTWPGYLPLSVDEQMSAIFRANAHALVGAENVAELGPIAASTDAGDLSHVLPVLHPNHGGCVGTNHGPDFVVSDPTAAYVTPSKALAWTVVDLLANGGAATQRVKSAFKQRLTKEAYLAHMRGLDRTERFDYP